MEAAFCSRFFILTGALLVGNIVAGLNGTASTTNVTLPGDANVTVSHGNNASNNSPSPTREKAGTGTQLVPERGGSSATAASTHDAEVADFAKQLGMLVRAGGIVPELRDAIASRQPLTEAQRRRVLDLAGLLGETITSVPEVFQGNDTAATLWKLLTDSSLLESLMNASLSIAPGSRETQRLGGGSPAPSSKPQPHTVNWLKCQADLLTMALGLGRGQMWALQMLDSWGKPEHSILRGNTMFLGNNQECRSVHYRNTSTFANVQGNICRMSIYLDFMQQYMAAFAAEPIPLILDVCLPRSCESVDLNSAFAENNMTFISATCTADLDIGDDPWAVVAVIVLSIFLALMVAGTLTEFCVGSKTRRRSEFINAFISSNSNSGIGNGISSITTNGGLDKLGGHLNGGFEMREVGYMTAGTDARHRVSGNHMNNLTKAGEESRHRETGIEANQEQSDTRVPNGDYTDDLPSYYPYDKSGHVGNGKAYLADPFLADSPDKMAIHRVRPAAEGREKKSDDTAHLAKWQRLLLAFSLPRNTGKILGVTAGPGSIGCLHGIRVLSMGWVIWGHVLSFGGTTGNFQNRMDMFELVKTFTFQVMVNATLSVDSFFFMSGLLTAYLFLKECGKNEKVTVKQGIMYYVHRYWRLTPPMLIWIMVVACIIQYVGEGRPGWTDFATAKLCRDSWWVNLLYVQNLWDEKAGCLGVTWYLANDMQFYILAPLVMIPWVYKREILGLIMAVSLVVVHLVSNAWLVYDYNFDILRPGDGYMSKLYVKPWARVGPFAIGLITGYILYKTKCKIRMNKYLVGIGWLLAMAVMLTVTLVTYDENKDPVKSLEGWPVGGKMVHETLSRPLWAMVLGWIVVACATGHGGFINSILSWEGFLPLSRLTYSAYLIHLSILAYEFYSADATYYYTMSNLIYRFFGMYVMSYAVAFLLAVGVEAPMLGLEKVVLPR